MSDILLVDDENRICKLLAAQLNDAGHNATGIDNPAAALEMVSTHAYDIIITDLRMPEIDGIELMKKIKDLAPVADVIIMTAYASVETAIQAMKEGAYDYIIKPFNTEELLLLVERLQEKRRLEIENQGLRSYLSRNLDEEIIGSSPPILHVKKLINDLCHSEASVLICGESGTGKELVARAIHKNSKRVEGPFIGLNCAAIPENLLESELFGYEKGAFTGASQKKLGHFQLASGGSLFLDEIGDLPASLQAKLLRVLENRSICPLGSEKETAVDFRLISATNRKLEDAIEKKDFREDLYYRLNVFPINLPALRQCREDIKAIASSFLQKTGRDPGILSESALRKLIQYNWPGNVRELRSVMERALILRPQGTITDSDILLGTREQDPSAEDQNDLSLDGMEKRMILRALKLAGGNKSEAARLLGITRRALYGRLEKHDLETD